MMRDIYQEITEQIVQSIEQGVGDFKLPWIQTTGMPANVESQKYYQGINTLALWVAAQKKSFAQGLWGTLKQWNRKGAVVRKGESGTFVVFYKTYEVETDDGPDTWRIIRYSHVFNVAQVDGYELETSEPISRLDDAEFYVGLTQAKIIRDGDKACYIPETDEIHMPDERLFMESEAYYATLFHELTHWTGAEHRLNRDLSGRFGDESYAMEELVAELGAAFQCAHLNITHTPREDHAHYIANWLNVLKGDKKAIFSAAARAQEAVNFLGGQYELRS